VSGLSAPAPATSTASGTVWRVAYKPDPWAWVPWEYAPFNGRFDDARGQFRVLYAGTTRLACFLEVTAQFRPDPVVAAELNVIVGNAEDAPYPVPAIGIVPADWRARRTLGEAQIAGVYLEIGAKESLGWLRWRLASRLIHYGLPDIDGATIRSTVPRAVTQEMSSVVYATTITGGLLPAGIRFESRHGNDVVLHAIYERPSAGDAASSRLLTGRSDQDINPADPELLAAAHIHGLVLE